MAASTYPIDSSREAVKLELMEPSLLMDLRPCYEGFAGIPQETRLLFAMFSAFKLKRFGGLASGIHHTSRRAKALNSPFRQTLEQTKAIISQDTRRQHFPFNGLIPNFIRKRVSKPYMVLTEMLRSEALDLKIDPILFEDFLWMKLFDHTLPPQDRHMLQRAEFIATELGHEYARSLSMLPKVFQRYLETSGWNIFFAATVSPYRVAHGTSTMIRYYDALPLLSPHTIGEPWLHALGHARMLERNVKDGANFYCDSEPVRCDLLRLFPEAEQRVHTIPITVSSEYYPDGCSTVQLQKLLRRRRSNTTLGSSGPIPAKLPKLFVAVATLEPRKNFIKLFRAFEIACGMTEEPIQLVIVANPGWRSEEEIKALKLMVADGAFHLSGVPGDELRVLYSMAHCVVAPSRAEGFDYSGVEAMACGTPVLASNIPVHRWVYGSAAEYFDPYDAKQLGELIARFAELPKQAGFLAAMRSRGLRQAQIYQPQVIAPKWEAAISQRLSSMHRSHPVDRSQ